MPEPGITVEVDGETRELPARVDYTGDGQPDAAVEIGAGQVIVFADTEDNETGADHPDGRADEASVVDKGTGRVVATARLDPRSGDWIDPGEAAHPAAAENSGTPTDPPGTDPVRARPAEVAGEMAGEVAGGPTAGAEPTAAGDAADGSTVAAGRMIVDVGGAPRELPAHTDYTGDGRPDAAVETADGTVIVFADTHGNATGAAEPDGRADEAWIVDKATGRVVGAARLDPATGTWAAEGAVGAEHREPDQR